jgi:hypothetical protein
MMNAPLKGYTVNIRALHFSPKGDQDEWLEGLDRMLFRDVHHLAGLPNHIAEQHRPIGRGKGMISWVWPHQEW